MNNTTVTINSFTDPATHYSLLIHNGRPVSCSCWSFTNRGNVFAFLSQSSHHLVLKENHFSRIAIKLGDHVTSHGSARSITFSFGHLLRAEPDKCEYPQVVSYLSKRDVSPGQWPTWQWTILHEVAHAILNRKQIKLRKRGYHFLTARLRPVKPHGKEFRLVLLRLAKKYPAMEVQS